MTVIIDYGVGNLFSLKSSFAHIGEEAVVSNDIKTIKNADRLVLPGVGAFGDAAALLRMHGMDEVLREEAKSGKAILGICLGMQMLFTKSYEYGEHNGLDLIKGSVVPMQPLLPKELKVPHIGWNELNIRKENALFKYINEKDRVYFVHSFFATDCDEAVISSTEYGITLTAAVAKDNVMGTQFHPEKSGNVGLNILRGFCEIN
ncbi:MAG: imidazole glycerol phosphate synthase subunit HisH [Clostridia bacterium]|nr:imidazole glycerol phosphate synthase subunit HisH [Clostridia bacterium]